ncbi:MAG TPA: hypothetical protein ENK01_01550 [Hellea balneolensis]|uniref:Uncharacterized protein n=1 Tax=Hellea balneolensis TaxID=287478 RepID=A0A7V5NWK7_9PROT|nr:hypothetical protein [Hellea balneolensis]
MKFLRVFLRLARATLFYPAMVGLFLWLYVRQAHWIYGLLVIMAILVLDPIWRIMARNLWAKSFKNSSKHR